MKLYRLAQEQQLPISVEEAWAFFSTPANLERLTPPELKFQILSELPERMFPGQIIAYRIRVAPLIWLRWVTEIKHVEEGRSFIDEQRFGPYRFWYHRHEFIEQEGGVLMRDEVHYGMPFGPLGRLVHACWVGRQLRQIFDYRRRICSDLFDAAQSAD